jgi:hypothetical protein
MENTKLQYLNVLFERNEGVEAFLAAIEEQARRRDDQDRDSMDQD